MRLSEKTIELNICSQISKVSTERIIWFGLTQKQEARAGFDAMTRFKGRLVLFQFKASNHTVKRSRRFHAQHDQMRRLIDRSGAVRRSEINLLGFVKNGFPGTDGSQYLFEDFEDFFDFAQLLGLNSKAAIIFDN